MPPQKAALPCHVVSPDPVHLYLVGAVVSCSNISIWLTEGGRLLPEINPVSLRYMKRVGVNGVSDRNFFVLFLLLISYEP